MRCCWIKSSLVQTPGHYLAKSGNLSCTCIGKCADNLENSQVWQGRTGVTLFLPPCFWQTMDWAYQSHAVPNMRLLLSDLMVQKNKRENFPPPTQRLILWRLIDVTTKKWCVKLRCRMRCSIKSSSSHNLGHSWRKVATSLVDVKGKAWTILNTVNGFDQFHKC